MTNSLSKKVLVVTGSLLDADESTPASSIKAVFGEAIVGKRPWLSLLVKFVTGEGLILGANEQKNLTQYSKRLNTFFEKNQKRPNSLTETVITNQLENAGLNFETMGIHSFRYHKHKREKALKNCSIIFISSTLIHDKFELTPILKQAKLFGGKVVVGGALASVLAKDKNLEKEIDLLAVGYGEWLIPSIANWINGLPFELNKQGRIEQRGHTTILYSGSPESQSLDFLPAPTWHGRATHVSYESVRGCPYRCSFCNYPYLFNDKIFRMKSAKKMADDWEYYYKKENVETITCLDSLFTMPKKRLIDFCQELISRKINIKWVCYARSSDLADEEVVILMKKAGAIQVQIGIESGNQKILDNMNKKTTVEENELALANCRKHGLTTVASYIIGYPGETIETVEETFHSIKRSPPDFYFLATFSVRIEDVPILSDASKKRFNLWKDDNRITMAPYWKHETMSCHETGKLQYQLEKRLTEEKISLNAGIFYENNINFDPIDRDEFLEFQFNAYQKMKGMKLMFKFIRTALSLLINVQIKYLQLKTKVGNEKQKNYLYDSH